MTMTSSLYLLFCILKSLVSTTSSQDNWSYKDVMATGKFCPERDSCSSAWWAGSGGAVAGAWRTLSWQTRNCFCDPDCSLYGDCCIDAGNASDMPTKSVLFSCVSFLFLCEFFSVFVHSYMYMYIFSGIFVNII